MTSLVQFWPLTRISCRLRYLVTPAFLKPAYVYPYRPFHHLYQKVMPPLIVGAILQEDQLSSQWIWFFNGSSYEQGTPQIRCAPVLVNYPNTILKGSCTPHSVQAAEIVAIILALEKTPVDEKVTTVYFTVLIW